MLSKILSLEKNPCPIHSRQDFSLYIWIQSSGELHKGNVTCRAFSFVKPIELLACGAAVSGDTGPASNGLLFVGFCRILRRAVLISFCCFWMWKKVLKCELKTFYSLKINLHYTLLSFPLDTRLSSSFSSHETEILTSSTLVVLYKIWE